MAASLFKVSKLFARSCSSSTYFMSILFLFSYSRLNSLLYLNYPMELIYFWIGCASLMCLTLRRVFERLFVFGSAINSKILKVFCLENCGLRDKLISLVCVDQLMESCPLCLLIVGEWMSFNWVG